MEPILVYLRRRLKEAGPAAWATLAQQVSVHLPHDRPMTEHSLRKIAYGDRVNPGLAHVQALLDHFGPPPRAAKQADPLKAAA